MPIDNKSRTFYLMVFIIFAKSANIYEICGAIELQQH